jgi:hypothetical protein
MSWPGVLTIGSLGERLDWHVRKGANLGTFRFEMEANELPVDLTGSEIFGWIKRKATDSIAVIDLEATILSPATEGMYTIPDLYNQLLELAGGTDLADPLSKYVWRLFLRDSLGRIIPIYHGFIFVLL